MHDTNNMVISVIKYRFKYWIAPRVGYKGVRLLRAHSWKGSICTIEPLWTPLLCICAVRVYNTHRSTVSQTPIFSNNKVLLYYIGDRGFGSKLEN